MALILIVEDEKLIRWGMRKQLEHYGHVVLEAPTMAEAAVHVRDHRPDIALLDLRLPDGNGLDFLQEQQAALAETAVIVVTASGQVEMAVRAMKLGAFDFLPKPLKEEDLVRVVGAALERQQERNAVERLKRDGERVTGSPPVAVSEAMRDVLRLCETVAGSAAGTVLVQGETGTGKEVVARFIHSRSARSGGPLVALNCAALPEQLVESELFGHEKGSFTDARSARKGIFELAHGGTVILDEIGELPMGMQAKFLRFLEERFFRRVGGMRDLWVDVRILALTNRTLEDRVNEGSFRSDLFYRLNVFPVQIPPLRERREDILPLALHFLKQYGTAGGRIFTDISPALRETLVRYDWPGNVRELRNLMERTSILEPGGIATGKFLPLASRAATTSGAIPVVSVLGDAVLPLDEVEFQMVKRAMKAEGGNQSKAAKLLGVSRDQVRYRVKRYREEGRWDERWGGVDAEE